MINFRIVIFCLLLVSCNDDYVESNRTNNASINANDFCGVKSLNNEALIYFNTNCASCHNVFKDATGPALNHNTLSHRNEEWILQFLTDRKKITPDKRMLQNIKMFNNIHCNTFSKSDSVILCELIKQIKNL